MAVPLQGIFTPNMVPLDSNDRIHEAELRRYVEWLISRGIHGLYPNGSTGEFLRFNSEERRQIIRIVCDQARGRVPILAGAAEANVRETIRACETYLDYGARAVAIVSPFYYRLSPSAVYAYFREIAVNTPIDVTLYNIPMFASPIEVETLQRLAEFPRIIGIKDSSGDISQMLRMMSALESSRPEFVFLAGWEPAMVPMLAMGCHGGTFAMSGIVPEVVLAMYESTISGQLAKARTQQMQLIQLFDRVVMGVEFPEGIRAAVEARGFDFGTSRQPTGQRLPPDRAELRRAIDELLARAGSQARDQ